MPIARHIFGRDKPSLTALAHGDGTPSNGGARSACTSCFDQFSCSARVRATRRRLHRESRCGISPSPRCRSQLGCWCC